MVLICSISGCSDSFNQSAAASVAGERQSGDVRAEVMRAMFVPAAEQSASDLLGAVAEGRAVQAQLQPELQVTFLQNAITKIHAIVDAEANKLHPDPEAALEARRLAAQVDSNRARVTTTGAPATATQATADVVTAADDLEAKMRTIDAKLSNIDTCTAALAGSGVQSGLVTRLSRGGTLIAPMPQGSESWAVACWRRASPSPARLPCSPRP